MAREELEKAWKWFPTEVNTNYELANTYARLAHESGKIGLNTQMDTGAKNRSGDTVNRSAPIAVTTKYFSISAPFSRKWA